MTRTVLLFLAAFTMTLAASVPASAVLRVTATVTDLGWLAERVGGDDVEVTVLCPGRQDPHTLPARPSLARRLGRADLLIYNGLELEIGWLPLLIGKARNPRVRPGSRGELDCSLAVSHLLEVPAGEVDRSRGDVHAQGNPHYLLDPRNGVAVAGLIAERMAEADPPSAERYRSRARDFASEMATRLVAWSRVAERLDGHAVVVYHQQWEYLLDWLGLPILGAIEHRPGISPSPRHVEQLVQRARDGGPVIVIAAPWNHIDAAAHVADRVDAPMLVLPAAVDALDDAAGYPEVFDRILAELVRAAAPEAAP